MPAITIILPKLEMIAIIENWQSRPVSWVCSGGWCLGQVQLEDRYHCCGIECMSVLCPGRRSILVNWCHPYYKPQAVGYPSHIIFPIIFPIFSLFLLPYYFFLFSLFFLLYQIRYIICNCFDYFIWSVFVGACSTQILDLCTAVSLTFV